MRVRRSARSSAVAVVICALLGVGSLLLVTGAGVGVITPDGAAVASGAGGVVTAQEDPGPGDGAPENNSSDVDIGDHWMSPSVTQAEDGNETENGSDDDGGGGIRDRIGSAVGAANPIPSTEDTMQAAWEWLQEQFAATMARLVDDVFNQLLGTPTIENDGAFGVMGSPVGSEEAAAIDAEEDGNQSATQNYTHLYDSVYLPYIMPLVGGVISLLALTVLIGPAISTVTQRRMFATLGSASLAVVLVVGSWEFAALLHAFSDAVTQFFLPNSDEILSSERTALSGPVALGVGVYFAGFGSGLALLALHTVRHMLLYVMPIVLPALLLVAYWGSYTRVKQVGSFFIWQYYALLVWNWPTALLLRIAYELDWQFHGSDLINLGMTMAIFFIAIALPLMISGSFTLIGLSMRGVASATAGSAVERARSRAPSLGSSGDTSRTRRAAQRLKSGGKERGIKARDRASEAWSRSRFSRSDGGGGSTSGSSRSVTDGGQTLSPSRADRVSGTSSGPVTPNQRQGVNHKGASHARSGKPRKRLERTDSGDYRVVDR